MIPFSFCSPNAEPSAFAAAIPNAGDTVAVPSSAPAQFTRSKARVNMPYQEFRALVRSTRRDGTVPGIGLYTLKPQNTTMR
jgi:hypothetical protein